MAGGRPETGPILYGVRRVVERESSQFVRRGGDSRVDQAFAFIRRHATDPIDVASVAKAAGVSRRTLEYLFRKRLKRSVGTILRMARLDFILKQVRETSLPTELICSQSGFRSESHAKRAFKARYGKPMSAFRNRSGFL